MIYSEDSWLQLSAIQHFAFCQRQWALIHIEGLWAENALTAQGSVVHERVHDASHEKRGDLLTLRDLRVYSPTLGVSGACDAVEFRSDPGGVSLHGRDGLWLPYPIEYKRGGPKPHQADELQLCAQAMCLEEMLLCDIPKGAMFYCETKRRQQVDLTDDLRKTVVHMLEQMHEYTKRGHTPRVKPKSGCQNCSLKNLCLPKLCKGQGAKAYLQSAIEEVRQCASS